jgi:hypothetical protein
MVAYSYKPRFIVPILVGLGLVEPGDGELTVGAFTISTFVRKNLPRPKRQTIRAIGKRRHARAGDGLQHYTGMRTKSCKLIGRATCTSTAAIAIDVRPHALHVSVDGENIKGGRIHDFAREDGFEHGEDMLAFWQKEHGMGKFEGVLILWEPLT